MYISKNIFTGFKMIVLKSSIAKSLSYKKVWKQFYIYFVD